MNNTENPRWPVKFTVEGEVIFAGNLKEKRVVEQALNRGGNVFEALAGLGLVDQAKKK
jgi:hypothetical protein